MIPNEMEDTLMVCPKCGGSGRIDPDEHDYDGCDRCNYGDGPTGFIPAEEAADDAANTLAGRHQASEHHDRGQRDD